MFCVVNSSFAWEARVCDELGWTSNLIYQVTFGARVKEHLFKPSPRLTLLTQALYDHEHPTSRQSSVQISGYCIWSGRGGDDIPPTCVH